MKPISIIEFARKIGLSPTTVSQAINGRGRVSPATREMVQRKMVEYGYVPNLHAQQLVTGRSQMVVMHYTNQDLLTDLFLVEMVHSVQHALHRRGYGLLLDTASDFTENENLLSRWLRTGAVDGVILVQGSADLGEWVTRFASRRTPIVLFGDHQPPKVAHAGGFHLDNRDAIKAVAVRLVTMGHKRIGYIGIDYDDVVAQVFRKELESLGETLPPELTTVGGYTPAGGAHAIRLLLSQPDPPTAVFCRKDDLAVGALNAAAQMGVRVPQQLSIVGHDDVPMAASTDPPLTTVRIDCNALGQDVVDMLFHLLDHPDDAPAPGTVIASLVERASVAPPFKS